MSECPANPLEKAGYVLEWHDEFEDPELDRAKWFPYYLPHWSARERSAPRYTFRDGQLVLQITQDHQPWCPEFDGEVKASCLQTGAFAGPVGNNRGQLQFRDGLIVREAQTNERLYTPQYGYFECRAKGVNTPGFHVALWMIGYEDSPEKSGEINIFEIFGKDVSPTSATVGYGMYARQDSTLADDFQQVQFEIDATEFHIYACEWTPDRVDYYIDNEKIGSSQQSAHYPMQFMLSLYELPWETAEPVYPQEFVVDYVRGYQPESGY